MGPAVTPRLHRGAQAATQDVHAAAVVMHIGRMCIPLFVQRGEGLSKVGGLSSEKSVLSPGYESYLSKEIPFLRL